MSNHPAEFNAEPQYRFIDPGENAISETPLPESIMVDFYPSYDDCVEIAQTINKKYSLKANIKNAFQAFFIVNMLMLPAVLLMYGAILAAAIALSFNIIAALIVLPAVTRSDYRGYYKALYPNFENELVNLELNEAGLIFRHLGNLSFYQWANIQSIVETKDAIFFYMRPSGFAVRKSGFAYDDDKDRFLKVARQRMNAAKNNGQSQIDKPAKKSLDY